MGMRRSIDTNTRRANSAGPAPPPNPAPHGEHHISAKIKLSPLDLWTVSKRFRTNFYLVATSLEKGSKCNFNKKKRDTGQGLYKFRNIHVYLRPCFKLLGIPVHCHVVQPGQKFCWFGELSSPFSRRRHRN